MVGAPIRNPIQIDPTATPSPFDTLSRFVFVVLRYIFIMLNLPPHRAQIYLRHARSPSSCPDLSSSGPDMSSPSLDLSSLCVALPRSTIFNCISAKIYHLRFRLKPNRPHLKIDLIQSNLLFGRWRVLFSAT
nr:hypothetical protein CFP56_18331 [Quercus suber]